ncbi:MAG TPA: hypothetical protein PKN56_25940 [Leptospiraceae bacterium]|nr:hypothetical protein [Leptospiraceae bacterium]HNF28330.1 hypothetical protein [Leptospiraceae bacterium]HNN07022.1 hypothetical protein [Leptospiraceae bacterium]
MDFPAMISVRYTDIFILSERCESHSFGRLLSSRLETIGKNQKDASVLDKQAAYSSKTVAVMFGFMTGLGKSSNAGSKSINIDKAENVFESLNDSRNSWSDIHSCKQNEDEHEADRRRCGKISIRY